MATVTGTKRLLDISGNNISTAVSLEASGTLLDVNGAAGTSGQVLSSTGTTVDWVNPSTVIGGPYLPLAGGIMTGNIILNDNVKTIYGTASDGLEIYHDGSNSFINDTGTGSLFIKSNGAGVYLKGYTSTDTYAQFLEGGAVNLYHNNVLKFVTTASGVTVTGTVSTTTFAGDLNGTINTATTGVTQSAGNSSTKIATTAFVTNAVSGTVTSVATGNANTLTKSGTSAVILTPNTGAVSSSSSNLATGAQIQTAINTALTGVLQFEGTWNANTNYPYLSSGTGTSGDYYIVSVAGNTNLDGITDWAIGDWAVFANTTWTKIDNSQVGNVTGSGVAGRVAYWNSASNLTSVASFTFNGSSLYVPSNIYANGGNSTEWNTAYDKTLQWDGGSTALVASTGRTSLGLGSLATLNSVAAGQIDANAVNASELNVSGNGASTQYLRSDGDGTFTWAIPTNTEGVTSINFKTDGTALNVNSNTITSSGTMTGIWQGTSAQYVNGLGDLTTFPSIPQGDITAVVAGTYLTGGGTTGSVTLNADGSTLAHITGSANATVGPGWMTVASTSTGRKAGEVYVTDGDSGDHAFIRIDWMRSYADSNFSVLNCGGNANRITGVRVLQETADVIYGPKYLQVYVEVSSLYYVIVTQPGSIPAFADLTAVTPIIQNTITGYALTGAQLEDLQNSSVGTDEGITVGGDLFVNGGDITLGGTGRIQGVDTVSSNTDAANKLYVDNAISGVPQGTVIGVVAGTNLNGGGAGGTLTLNLDAAIELTSVELGTGVTLSESGDRPDLLYIESSTSTWGGLQIGNTSSEFIFSLMGDGTKGGLYDDQNSDWLIDWNENAGVSLFYNGVAKLTTTSGGATVTGDLTVSGGDIVLQGTGRIQGIDTVSATNDAANKAYVDNAVSGVSSGVTSVSGTGTVSGLTLTGTVTSTGNLTLGGTLSLTSANVTGGLGFTPYNATNPSGYTTNTGTTTASNTQTFTNKSGNISQWTNDSGYLTSAGDITGVTAGTGLSGGGTTGTVSLALDLGELTAGGTLIATDYLIAENGGVDNRQLISSIPLSIFNNNSGWTSNTGTTTASNTQTFTNKSGNISQWTNDAGYTTSVGDITGVTAGSGLTGGGASGTVTVNVDYVGSGNLVDAAGAGTTIVTADKILYEDATDSTVKEIAISSLVALAPQGDITGITAGTGISGGGTSGTVSLALDLGELGVGNTLVGTDYLIAENGGADKRQLVSSIPLSIFSNNSAWTSNTGTTTASNTQTFTNKSGNISQWSNDSGYITSYSNTNIGNTNLSTPASASRTFTLGSGSTFVIQNASAAYLAIFSESNTFLQNDVIIGAVSTTTSLLKFRGNSASGSTAISLRAPDTVSAAATYILPQLPGSANLVLSSTTGGTMSWEAAGTVTSVGTGSGLTGGTFTTLGTISPDYAGGSNIILAAADGSGTTLDVNDRLLFSDAAEDVQFCNVDDLPFSTTPSDVGLSSISNNGNTITGSLTLTSTLYVPYQISHVGDTTTRMQFSTGQWTVYTSNSARLQCNSTYTRVNQNFVCTGNITAYFSDERLKTKTGNIENALDKINSLEGFTYVENDLAKSLGFDNNKQQVGLSAQSVKAVLPEAVALAPIDYLEDELNNDGEPVSKSGEDYLTVDYSKLVPLLIEAVKELTSEVADLKSKLK